MSLRLLCYIDLDIATLSDHEVIVFVLHDLYSSHTTNVEQSTTKHHTDITALAISEIQEDTLKAVNTELILRSKNYEIPDDNCTELYIERKVNEIEEQLTHILNRYVLPLKIVARSK